MKAMPPARTPWQPRFWIKVVDTGTCWLWTGTRARNGYGRFRKDHGGPSFAAHRLAYELLVGPIPEGHDLDHLCRVRRCVNPAHLEPVTRAVNLARGSTEHWGANRNKDRCDNGHEMTEANTYVRPDRPNRRECRKCRRAAGARHRTSHRAVS
jgi:hypothetical protein